MKAIILAGGFGTRISEETSLRPKPMVEIGGLPILWHILNHSTVPLRFATYFGLVTSALTVVLMLFYAFGRLILGAQWPAGFTTLAALILLSISINAMLLGIIGEYLGRMYRQVRETPVTIIESVIDDYPADRRT